MRILLLFNPISGTGRAPAVAHALLGPLRGAGHQCELVETRRGPDMAWLDQALSSRPDLLVVVGGDGAVRLAAGPAARAGVPLWQCPLGTENLFAREWGMRPGAAALLRAIHHHDVVEMDLGDADGEVFVLMASAGLDAYVVHDLASRRRGGISHLSYAGPVVRALRSHRPQRLAVDVDGARLDIEGPGFLVVANARQYALRMDPLPRANPADGLLDVRWFPAAGVMGVAWWSLLCMLRRQEGHQRAVTACGRRITVRGDQPFLYQLDGDPPSARPVHEAVERLEICVRRERLRVLRGG